MRSTGHLAAVIPRIWARISVLSRTEAPATDSCTPSRLRSVCTRRNRRQHEFRSLHSAFHAPPALAIVYIHIAPPTSHHPFSSVSPPSMQRYHHILCCCAQNLPSPQKTCAFRNAVASQPTPQQRNTISQSILKTPSKDSRSKSRSAQQLRVPTNSLCACSVYRYTPSPLHFGARGYQSGARVDW